MTAAGVAGVQDVAPFVAMITLVPVLFLLLAVLKAGRIARSLSQAGCHNRMANGKKFIAARGRRRCARSSELTEHAGMTLRLAREKPAVRALLARDSALDRIGYESVPVAAGITAYQEHLKRYYGQRPVRRPGRSVPDAGRGSACVGG